MTFQITHQIHHHHSQNLHSSHHAFHNDDSSTSLTSKPVFNFIQDADRHASSVHTNIDRFPISNQMGKYKEMFRNPNSSVSDSTTTTAAIAITCSSSSMTSSCSPSPFLPHIRSTSSLSSSVSRTSENHHRHHQESQQTSNHVKHNANQTSNYNTYDLKKTFLKAPSPSSFQAPLNSGQNESYIQQETYRHQEQQLQYRLQQTNRNSYYQYISQQNGLPCLSSSSFKHQSSTTSSRLSTQELFKNSNLKSNLPTTTTTAMKNRLSLSSSSSLTSIHATNLNSLTSPPLSFSSFNTIPTNNHSTPYLTSSSHEIPMKQASCSFAPDGLMMLASLASSAKPMTSHYQEEEESHSPLTTAKEDLSNANNMESRKALLNQSSSFSTLIAAAATLATQPTAVNIKEPTYLKEVQMNVPEATIYYQENVSPNVFQYMKVLDKMNPPPPLVVLNPNRYQEVEFNHYNHQTSPTFISQH